jgi:hypothetical protein
MPERSTPNDLDEFLPDEAAVKAVMDGPAKYNKNVDPKLLARLQELKLRTSAPEITPPAPPSVAVYVPPTQVQPGAKPRDGAAKVELPPAASEYPTQPSLKRLAEEPEVPGVARARGNARLVSGRPVSLKGAALAVLAVVAPLVVVISLLGRGTHGEGRGETTSAATGSVPVRVPSAQPSAAASVAPAVTSSAAPAVTASAAVPAAPAGTARQRPRAVVDDPYDAAPPRPSAAPTAEPQATATPSALPIAPPTPTGPSAPAPKPEY